MFIEGLNDEFRDPEDDEDGTETSSKTIRSDDLSSLPGLTAQQI